jgi:hypothetical protein
MCLPDGDAQPAAASVWVVLLEGEEETEKKKPNKSTPKNKRSADGGPLFPFVALRVVSRPTKGRRGGTNPAL